MSNWWLVVAWSPLKKEMPYTVTMKLRHTVVPYCRGTISPPTFHVRVPPFSVPEWIFPSGWIAVPLTLIELVESDQPDFDENTTRGLTSQPLSAS